jgi:hypothetical protein
VGIDCGQNPTAIAEPHNASFRTGTLKLYSIFHHRAYVGFLLRCHTNIPAAYELGRMTAHLVGQGILSVVSVAKPWGYVLQLPCGGLLVALRNIPGFVSS